MIISTIPPSKYCPTCHAPEFLHLQVDGGQCLFPPCTSISRCFQNNTGLRGNGHKNEVEGIKKAHKERSNLDKEKKRKEEEDKKAETSKRAQTLRSVLQVKGTIPSGSGSATFNNMVGDRRKKELADQATTIQGRSTKRKCAPVSTSHSTDAIMTVEQEGGLLLRTLRKWADEDFVKFLEGGHGRRRRRNRRDRSDGFVADLHCSSCILVEKQSFFWWEPVENEINFVCFHSCLIWLEFIFLAARSRMWRWTLLGRLLSGDLSR